MRTNSTRQYFIIALLLSLAIGVTIHFPMVMNYIFGESEGRHGGRFIISFSHLGTELFITFLVALLMFTLNFFILRPVEKHRKIHLLTIILSVFMTLVAVFILNDLFYKLLRSVDSGPSPRGYQDEFIYRNFFVSVLVIGCILIIRLIFQKQSVQIENETLKREALQSQFESLKNQLSPHFLFNSLTALKTLIRETPETAQNYVNNLSNALRYTLQSNEKQLVTLKEEMEFMESYLFLIRMRFDTNLSVNTSINENYLSYRLPPLTIQTLVENAIKHNEISKRSPLKIDILTTENDSLIILNNIQKKLTDEEGTGIGLTNLSKQFQLLLGKDITISIENDQFKVEIPLIKQ
ncbi:MAG: histidine kinase [Bacteroidales bacterium]|nr:histidine kinase [Bacteroidales bacterium]